MLSAEIAEDAVANDVDAMLDAWRAKAATIILAIATVAILPPLLAVLTGRIFYLVPPLRIACVLLFLALAITAIRPHWKLKWRATLILGALAVFGMIQLSVTHLSGSGRLSLQALPLIALVLLGPRAGWWATALSLSLYTAVVLLSQTELLADCCMDCARPSLSFWLLQGLRMGGYLLLIMTLLTRLLALQRRTMIAEKTTLQELETETEDRQRLQAEIFRVSESERLKLGAELHDGLCQHLTAALLNCTAIENQGASGTPKAGRGITQIRESIEESIDMAYDVARGLCPLDMTPDALIPALERLCRRVSDRQGIACRMQTDGSVTIENPEYALHLYRMAGEAVANAVKHAQCSQILVRLTQENDELLLSVSDNGRGIPADVKAGEGLGRRIMAHRAELMGGALSVFTEPERGTTVTCRLPDVKGLS